MSIKIKIKKFFNTEPETIDKSRVEFEVEVKEADKKSLFDKAVKQVVDRELTKTIEEQLNRLCVGDEVYDQTVAAMEKHYEVVSDTYKGPSIRELYPKAMMNGSHYGNPYGFGLIDLGMLASKIVEEADL